MSKYLQESYDEALKEIEQLKAKLLIAQKALESVTNAPAREIMRKYAEKALDQLKEE